MPKTNKNHAPWYLALCIVTLVSLLVWCEKAGASLSDILFGSPVWSVSCSGCTQSETFAPQVTLRQPSFVTSAVWSSDGKYLSVASEFERSINIYDTSNWKVISHFLRDSAAGDNNSVIQFDNGDDSLMVPRITTPSYEDVSIEKWSFSSNNSLKKYIAEIPQNGALSPVFDVSGSKPAAIAVSPSGVLLASSIGDKIGAYISVFRQDNDQILDTITCAPNSVPQAIAFSADSSKLTVGDCHLNEVENYDILTGKKVFVSDVDPGHWMYNFISYSPSGMLIAVGSSDAEHGTVIILNSGSGHIVETLPREHANITNLQWINDHLVLASYDGWDPDGGMARVWDTNSKSLVAAFAGRYLQFTSISPNGRQLAAAIGNQVIIGNLKNMSSGN